MQPVRVTIKYGTKLNSSRYSIRQEWFLFKFVRWGILYTSNKSYEIKKIMLRAYLSLSLSLSLHRSKRIDVLGIERVGFAMWKLEKGREWRFFVGNRREKIEARS